MTSEGHVTLKTRVITAETSAFAITGIKYILKLLLLFNYIKIETFINALYHSLYVFTVFLIK